MTPFGTRDRLEGRGGGTYPKANNLKRLDIHYFSVSLQSPIWL